MNHSQRLKICERCGAFTKHKCPPLIPRSQITEAPASRGRTARFFRCPKCFEPVHSINTPDRRGILTDTCDCCLKVFRVRLATHTPRRPIKRDTDINNHKHRSARPQN